jgi:DNA-binding NarL/FixJ family response regulator
MIAEDDQFMRQAMVDFLGKRFEIIGVVHDGRGLVDAAISLLPDVIVSDISMPRLTGLQAMRELSARGCKIPFLFVTSEPALVEQGTLSFLDKLDICTELVPAVETVAAGKPYISPRARLPRSRF